MILSVGEGLEVFYQYAEDEKHQADEHEPEIITSNHGGAGSEAADQPQNSQGDRDEKGDNFRGCKFNLSLLNAIE